MKNKNIELLRFTTAGSVDDGKAINWPSSYDSKSMKTSLMLSKIK